MNTNVIIEAIGYTGSALVLVSFLMVSVVKLRIVNTIGSIIFTVYAFIIHSYPTAIMNICLVLINIYHLIKLSNTKTDSRTYDLVNVSPDDSMLKYTLSRSESDILKSFPGMSMDFSGANSAYMICHEGNPAGIFIGVLGENGSMEILLDYSLPEYRDFSIGQFLFSKLPQEGIHTLTFRGPDDNHKDYLSKYEFAKRGSQYIKIL
ncbi:MAG: YgjV family protein [Butyrivibrio sp.]|nr:YgjV family protein [Butyrivibrio sp.]